MKALLKSLAAAVALSMSITSAIAAGDWKSDVDFTRADLSKIKLDLINEGKKAGRMEYGWRKVGGTYVIEDLTEMEPNIFETATGVLDAKTLMPKSVDVDFAMGPTRMIVDLDWQDEHMTGAITIKREGQEDRVHNADTTIAAPLRLAVFGLISSLPLEAGYKTEFPWFSSMSNSVENITLIVTGSEMVETPAGTFDTYKVAVTGGSVENNVYVTKSLPRKTVRIDVVGRPMHFLLTE